MDWWKRRARQLSNNIVRGSRAEKLARRFLKRQGLRFCRANVRLGKDEIDLVFRDSACWVLVEVRYRHHSQFGSALESVHGAKLSYIKRAANRFTKHPMYQSEPLSIRIDIISISGNIHNPNINWVPNAIPFDISNF